jgi:hypothetical protein
LTILSPHLFFLFFKLFRVTEDEVLLLPEIFSTLDMEKVKRDFAKEGDTADELELRNSRWYVYTSFLSFFLFQNVESEFYSGYLQHC